MNEKVWFILVQSSLTVLQYWLRFYLPPALSPFLCLRHCSNHFLFRVGLNPSTFTQISEASLNESKTLCFGGTGCYRQRFETTPKWRPKWRTKVMIVWIHWHRWRRSIQVLPQCLFETTPSNDILRILDCNWKLNENSIRFAFALPSVCYLFWTSVKAPAFPVDFSIKDPENVPGTEF